MIVDLHVHSDASDDSRAPVEGYLTWLAKRRSERPIDAIVLTEHRHFDLDRDVRGLEDRYGIRILRGALRCLEIELLTLLKQHLGSLMVPGLHGLAGRNRLLLNDRIVRRGRCQAFQQTQMTLRDLGKHLRPAFGGNLLFTEGAEETADGTLRNP